MIQVSDLYILNSSEAVNKCKNYADYNYRCEYKQYAADVFNDILLKEGVHLNEIAK